MRRVIPWLVIAASFAALLALGAVAHNRFCGPHSYHVPFHPVQSAEQTVRSQIELYYCQERNQYPWDPGRVAKIQWDELLGRGYLHTVPRNEHSAADVATKIVELTEPGATGYELDPREAGWAWNSADHIFYAVGLPEHLQRVPAPGP
ncbi:MAG: hypothetical protein ACYTGM_07810 [Planctomycetota bacterium]|jgi:hypothetical protein